MKFTKREFPLAYQVVDPEGDVWAEDVLIFTCGQDVEDFFADPDNVLKALGAEDDGEWHLEIRNVSLEDDGRYQCQVGATHNAGPIRSVKSNVKKINTGSQMADSTYLL